MSTDHSSYADQRWFLSQLTRDLSNGTVAKSILDSQSARTERCDAYSPSSVESTVRNVTTARNIVAARKRRVCVEYICKYAANRLQSACDAEEDLSDDEIEQRHKIAKTWHEGHQALDALDSISADFSNGRLKRANATMCEYLKLTNQEPIAHALVAINDSLQHGLGQIENSLDYMSDMVDGVASNTDKTTTAIEASTVVLSDIKSEISYYVANQ